MFNSNAAMDVASPSASEARHLQEVANRGDRESTEIARLDGASQANLQAASSSGPYSDDALPEKPSDEMTF